MATNKIELSTISSVSKKINGSIGKLTSAIDVVNNIKRNTNQEVLDRNGLNSSLNTLVSDIENVKTGIKAIISVLDDTVNAYNEGNTILNNEVNSMLGELPGLNINTSFLNSSKGKSGTNVSKNTNTSKPGDKDFIGPLPLEMQMKKTGATIANKETESFWDKVGNKISSGWDWVTTKLSSLWGSLTAAGASLCDSVAGWFKTDEKKDVKKSENKTNKSNITDLSLDDNGGWLWASEKTTLVSDAGARIIYDERKELEDGTVEYYNERGTVIKRILPDGSCEISSLAFGSKFYDTEGKSVGGAVDFHSIGGPHKADKLVIYPDGTKEYFVGNNLFRKEELDGSYIEYFTSGVWGSLSNGELRIQKVYHSDGTYETYKDSVNKVIDRKYQADGSYVEFAMDGTITKERLSDETVLTYFPNGQARFEEKPNGDLIEYDKDGKIIKKEYNGGCLRGGITESYSEGKLIKKSTVGKDEYYSLSGKLLVTYDGEQRQYVVYNDDGTTDTYDESQVDSFSGVGKKVPEGSKHIITVDLNDGTKRIISNNGEVMYDKNTNSHTFGTGNNKFSDFGYLVGRDNISSRLNELGISVDSSELPSTSYVYAFYDNDKVSSVDLYEGGMSGKHGGCTFIRKITVFPNGQIETHEIYCKLMDGVQAYVPKDVFANPDAYISEIIEQN